MVVFLDLECAIIWLNKGILLIVKIISLNSFYLRFLILTYQVALAQIIFILRYIHFIMLILIFEVIFHFLYFFTGSIKRFQSVLGLWLKFRMVNNFLYILYHLFSLTIFQNFLDTFHAFKLFLFIKRKNQLIQIINQNISQLRIVLTRPIQK